jgi:hypothetical protein
VACAIVSSLSAAQKAVSPSGELLISYIRLSAWNVMRSTGVLWIIQFLKAPINTASGLISRSRDRLNLLENLPSIHITSLEE